MLITDVVKIKATKQADIDALDPLTPQDIMENQKNAYVK